MYKFTSFSSLDSQRGAALLIALVVMFALSLIAISMSNSSTLQYSMSRNYQLQQEAWNESYSEIAFQINQINARSVSDGAPAYIRNLSESAEAVCIQNGCDEIKENQSVQTASKIALESLKCIATEQATSVGVIGVNDLRLEVNSSLFDSKGAVATAIGSDQRQRFTTSFTYNQAGNCTAEEEVSDQAHNRLG